MATARQKLFAKYWCDTLNATAAARMAGYSEKTAAQMGYENLRKPEVKALIHERMRELSHTADLEETLVFLTKVMRGEIKDQFDLDPALSDRMRAAETLLKRFGQLVENESGNANREISVTIKGFDGGDYSV